MSVLDKIREVKIPRPSDQVVKQFKELLVNGALKPGDLLPSERELAASFGLGRGYIREAIKTFELYGIFKSIPGRGTMVADLSIDGYAEFLNNIIQFGTKDYLEMLDVRSILEPAIAYRAALHATDQEIQAIGDSLARLKDKLDNGIIDLDHECEFHLDIAKATHNRFLNVSMGIILPDLTRMGREINVLRDERYKDSYKEHARVYEALRRRDPEGAQRAMHHHMVETERQFTYCISLMRKEKEGR